MTSKNRSGHYSRTKRVVDVTVATLVYVLSLPVQAAVGALVFVSLGSPVLFRQARPGKRGEIFTLVKFRTMKRIDVSRGLVDDSERLTKIGRFLRSTSLDELPTLVNVIKGDMSLVGPRPLLVDYLERYSPRQARRHEVRPGITGLAQVNGRNSLTWEEKLEFDVVYVDSMSLLLDFKILALTAKSVISRSGITTPGHATAQVFRGTAESDGDDLRRE